jgi:GTPase
MSSVVGIDLSSSAIHMAKLDETAPVVRVDEITLTGKDAWARTLQLARYMRTPSWYWDDVYLVAIEAPYGHPGTVALLGRVVGVLVAGAVPQGLRSAECCWIVRPDEWKKGLRLQVRGKPTEEEVVDRLGAGSAVDGDLGKQDVRDAICIALWARDENAKGVTAAA